MTKVLLPPNVPQTIALQDPEGDYKPDAAQVEYLTTCGRLLVLDKDAATRLNMMDMQPGETFTICKRVSGRRGELPYIDLALTASTERQRAQTEAEAAMPPESPQPAKAAEQPAVLRSKRRSAKVHEIRPDPVVQPALFDRRGTGTYGPAPQPALPSRHAPPARIPFNVAFQEVTGFVTSGLKATGEQWNDEAKQAAVCTILISAAKQGLLTLWERPNE